MPTMKTKKDIDVEVVAEIGNDCEGEMAKKIVARKEDGSYLIGSPTSSPVKTWVITHNGVVWKMRPWREHGLVIALTTDDWISVLSTPDFIAAVVKGKVFPSPPLYPDDSFLRVYGDSLTDIRSAVVAEIERLENRLLLAKEGAHELIAGIDKALGYSSLSFSEVVELSSFSAPHEHDFNELAALRKWRQGFDTFYV